MLSQQEKREINRLYNYADLSLSSVHVRVAQFAHEGVRANHLLDSHPHRKLGVPVTELVNIYRDYGGLVVEFYKALKMLN